MRVAQCDNCNEIFQMTGTQTWSEVKITFYKNTNLQNTHYMDLCPECTQKVMDYINQKQNSSNSIDQ